MKKKTCLLIQIVLLVWFFLSMIGIRLGDKYLVTCSYKDDGIFFIIYVISLLLFIFKERIGKFIMAIWLSMWLITQFLSHEWYTIFNKGYMGLVDVKMKYFSDTIHWLDIESRYVPDLYHTILHLLILSALIMLIMYIKKNKH